MKPARIFVDMLYRNSPKRLEPVVDALDEFFFGTPARTSGPPHILDNLGVKRYISTVIVALIPSAAAAVYFFGLRAVWIILVSYVFGGALEAAFAVVRKKEINEGFLATGIIFALILPPDIPLWMAAVGIVVGVFFGKEVFGGSGKNIFNPALVGRLFITVAFPAAMTTSWRIPGADAVTSATPLVVFKAQSVVSAYGGLLFGGYAGSMGEIFRAGIIVGGLFLIFAKVANWRVPLSYLATVIVAAFLGNIFLPGRVAPPVFQILSGGLLFGAMFMATDPVTSPFTMAGKWIFGAGCGILTVLIRGFSGFVEGVMFAIIFMNALAPLIDTVVMDLKYKKVPR